jgi:mannose-6-phosphate isomerase
MHLLEALHALYEASGESSWLTEAETILTLFRESFFDPSTATLGEFFTPSWAPHPNQGHIVEPGHHFEWVWLLHRHAALTGLPVDPAADALFATAWQYGFDPESGGIYDQIDRSGAPVERTRRIWPVTEAIKACVVRREAGLDVSVDKPAKLIDHLFADFIRPAQLGWVERLNRDGSPLQTTLPGSTPYHIFLAAAEVARPRG